MADYLIRKETLEQIGDAVRTVRRYSDNHLIDVPNISQEINELYDTDDATAAARDIIAGKTAYTNGGKATGTIRVNNEDSLSIDGSVVTVPDGYYPKMVTAHVDSAILSDPSISIKSSGEITATVTQSSAGYVTKGSKSQATMMLSSTHDADFVEENIKNGITIFGKTGTYRNEETVVSQIWIDTINGNRVVKDLTADPARAWILTIPMTSGTGLGNITVAISSPNATLVSAQVSVNQSVEIIYGFDKIFVSGKAAKTLNGAVPTSITLRPQYPADNSSTEFAATFQYIK